jgi:cyclopropane-fatty-acyl-phospholipid synthase
MNTVSSDTSFGLRALPQLKLPAGLAVLLPNGQRLGDAGATVTVELRDAALLGDVALGRIGAIASAYVEGRLQLRGSMREICDTGAALLPSPPVSPLSPLSPVSPVVSGRRLRAAVQAAQRQLWSWWRHCPGVDARQVQFHYDVGDDFYALWLDPRRVYSCAYWPPGCNTLAQAQEAKLDLICRKLQLAPGQRLLDVGAGWGGLLLWAAEHYGVQATGITLSKHQHAHVHRLIEERGLRGRVHMQLMDYRALPEASEDGPGDRYDRIASVGMFEHVGRAQMNAYFAKLQRLLAPGGLLLNHGITAASMQHLGLGAGISEFIERYIFPGGEILHVATAIEAAAHAGLETLDVENLRPHYARTLWAWSDALEQQLDVARTLVPEQTLRAYRLYLAGSAMAFERGWLQLHQVLLGKLNGQLESATGPRGAQSAYLFTRDHMLRPCSTNSNPKPPVT